MSLLRGLRSTNWNREKMFLGALCLSFISKALNAVLMKSSITQIERRFDISSSTVGLIDGSFEIGWEKESGSYMWIYVLMGNMLRGIGETPITPLGISYIDDFAPEGHSSFYLGNLHAIAMIGPIIGFTVGSIFSKMYVDIGYVDLSTVRITPKDSRWVGAWWLGFLMGGLIAIISSIPFFFLPKNPYKPQKERKASVSSPVQNEEKSQKANLTKRGQKFTESINGFFQSLKSILTNPLYVITLFMTLLQISSHIGSFTYVFKYVEQQYGQSASEANILFGSISIPTLATGMFTGGYIIKRFKLTLVGIAKLSFFTHALAFIFHLLNFALICENKSVAGLTLTYDGINPVASHINVPLSYCNSDCSCDESQWEPVCGDNGITYMSPCLAGCKSSSGSKKSIVFHNCSCAEINGFQNGNNSVKLGECPRENQCARKFYIYIVIQILGFLSMALGSTATIMLIFKNVQPELKSLAVGFHSLTIRALVMALIPFLSIFCILESKHTVLHTIPNENCLFYFFSFHRNTFFGLSTCLKFSALILYVVLISAMKKKYEGKNTKSSEPEGKAVNEANLEPLNGDATADHETHI
ncbi:Solute carrier organic anion transporter family member 1B3 [Camelus dromedarius]|uniref:Solute carrier organic anion transporter family member n=1 Tax=Camelus dromedarius TaxID=9838 RepID=A0A5N4C6Q1_CAMDR|nr:Solute carrier organic anion transporter family member 1B3 [Camelus dromedarius]